MQNANKGRFWSMTCSGADPKGGGEDARSWVELDITPKQEEELETGSKLRYTKYPVVGRADRRLLEDCPWVDSEVAVVSTRFKDIIESAAPGQCQFIPIDIMYNELPVDNDYWVLNLLNVIDCIDKHRSIEFRRSNDQMDESYYFPVVNPEKVPTEISIFRVKLSEANIMVRSKLRDTIRRARVSGVQFIDFEIAMND